MCLAYLEVSNLIFSASRYEPIGMNEHKQAMPSLMAPYDYLID